MCSTGAVVRLAAHSIRSLRARPKRLSRQAGEEDVRRARTRGRRRRTPAEATGRRSTPTASKPNSPSTGWVTSTRTQRGVADLADVDDLAGDRLVLRRGERDVRGAGVDQLADAAEQLAAARHLVQERQNRPALDRGRGDCFAHEPPPPDAAPTTAGGSVTSAPSSLCMIAWRAPGTPYS